MNPDRYEPVQLSDLAQEGKLFITRYGVSGTFFGTQIEAADYGDAVALARIRGLNEIVLGEAEGDPETQIISLIRRKDWLAAAHEASFLGFIGLTSGALSAREVLSDTGLVHELLHLASFADEADEQKEREAHAYQVARDFISRVPGWPQRELFDKDFLSDLAEHLDA